MHFQSDTSEENAVCRGLTVKPAEKQCSLQNNLGESQPFSTLASCLRYSTGMNAVALS